MNPSIHLFWNAVSNAARLSSALQIILFLPLTLATLSVNGFLLLSFLLCIQSLIHGTLMLFLNSNALSIIQVPAPPFLLLVCFNAFAQAGANPYLEMAAYWWGRFLTFSGPIFIVMEGLSTLIVAQKMGQEGKKLIEGEGEGYQFALLISTAVTYVASAWWIVVSYPAAAATPLSATLVGVALTSFVFLTFIGFGLRRTNIIESAGLSLFIAYNIWLCGNDQNPFSVFSSTYAPLLPNIVPHFQTLVNFITNTLPTPVLVALIFRLTVLHYASRILPTIGADSWEGDPGVAGGWDERPTSTLTRIVLTYRQSIFVTVYSHLLLLDHNSSIWWRWVNVFFTLVIWSVELLVSEEDAHVKDWKVD